MTQLLLDAGADMELKCDDITPLWCAVSKGNAGAVRVLLDAGANPDCVDPNGATALFITAQLNRVPEMRMLLQAGADKDKANNSPHGDLTPLMIATCRRNVEAVRTLLAAGADEQRVDDEGRTALAIAIANDYCANCTGGACPHKVERGHGVQSEHPCLPLLQKE